MEFIKKLEGKTIGILGMGYLGSNIVRILKDSGVEMEIVEIDMHNFEEIREHEFDYFINCAGLSDFKEKMVETIDSNVGLTGTLLRELNVKTCFLTMSSTRIYGFSTDKDIVFNENSSGDNAHLNLDYIYNGSKMLSECLLMNYAKYLNYRIVCVRLSNAIGSFDKLNDTTFIKLMLRMKKEGKKLTVKGQNRNSTKDYIFIDDAVEGIIRTLLLSEKNDVYNIASGKSYSISELCGMLDLPPEYIDETDKAVHSRIATAKAKECLGFEAETGIEEALKKTLERL